MHVEDQKNRSLANGSLSLSVAGERTEELITYKRRKHSRPCPGSQQTTDKEDRHPGIDCPVLQLYTNNCKHGYWEKVLKQMLQSPDVSEGGIRNCIQNALSSTSGFDSNNATPKQTAEEKDSVYFHGVGHNKHLSQVQGESQKPNGSWNASNGHRGTSDHSHKEPKDQTNDCSITERCQSVLFDIIVSDKFSLLCSLLCSNFQGIKAGDIFDFKLINSKMEEGEYEECSQLFANDIQQVWRKLEKIGEEMVNLAKSLSSISRASYRKQVTNQYVDLDATRKYPSNRICTCKNCGDVADGKRRLVCDGCEAMYHISCIEPPVEEIPTKNWYCAACLANGKESPKSDSVQNHGENLHQDCVVCERLKDTRTQDCNGVDHTETTSIFDDSEDSSDCSTEIDGLRASRRRTSSRLCKLCKTGEEDGKKFMICEHEHCPYKYYHRMCLRYKQFTCPQSRWYCPSCLCRSCLIDKDDDKIVLCDGCDEAYHIYCMVPPRTSIPKGKWYCMFCMIEIRARRRMLIKGDPFLDKWRENNAGKSNTSAGGSVHMLLSAAEKLNSEEKPTTRKKNW